MLINNLNKVDAHHNQTDDGAEPSKASKRLCYITILISWLSIKASGVE